MKGAGVRCATMARQDAGDTDDAFIDRSPWRSVPLASETLMIPRRVLVLEDNLIIAMEAEDVLRKIGTEVIDIASNIDEAVAAVDTGQYDLALLDVNLGEAMSFNFARLLTERGVPFGFVSGYSDTLDFPDDLQGAPLLVKPFDEWAMQQFLAKLFPV
jgi:CheY-like chemotaxis protein